MPHENQPEAIRAFPKISYYVTGEHGQVHPNDENLPLQALTSLGHLSGLEKLLRFAFDPAKAIMYVLDGKDWHSNISNGEESAWSVLNHALNHIHDNFKVHPQLHFGEPPNTADKRKLSEFPVAWDAIKGYINKEFGSDPKDIPVIEYVPSEPVNERVKFSPEGCEIGDLKVDEPVILVNRNIGAFGQPDYNRVNQLLIHEYLRNYSKIDPKAFEKHADDGDELYFAIWQNDDTRMFKTKSEQRMRIVDEEALLQEKSLKNHKGPVVMFNYLPIEQRVVLLNSSPEDVSDYDIPRQMVEDVVRKISKIKEIPESKIVISHGDHICKPFVTKISKFSMVWDIVTHIFAPELKIVLKDIAVLVCPLTTSGSQKALFVKNLGDEQSLPMARQMRIKHGLHLDYPFIAIDSRVSSTGMRAHLLLREYAKFENELTSLPLFDYVFNEDVGDESTAHFIEQATSPDEKMAIKEIMAFMLSMGLGSKSILDFFSPRKNLIQRSIFMNYLKEVSGKYNEDLVARTPLGIEKTASLDIGINDWQFIDLQESLNQSQHTNDQQSQPVGRPDSDVKPFNLRVKRPDFVQGPRTMEGLLHKKHDREFNYMKSMEQLLRESQI